MVPLQSQRKRLSWPSLTGRCVVSCTMVLLTQFALSLVPRFLPTSPLLIQLSLSVVLMLVVVGLGGLFRRLLGIHASAPALVFFNILFIWCFYVLIIRKGLSLVMDVVFNGEVVLLLTGLCSMLKSDPGLVEPSFSDKLVESSASEIITAHNEDSDFGRRVRYCKICKGYIKGFDHHCPAFGNCIGQKNYLLFMVLLVGFLVTEACYLACSSEYAVKSGTSSMLSSEVAFFTWHLYGICFNIRTDEWVNWKKYPEFQLIVQYQPGQSSTEIRFTNPHDKGILQNVKEFMSLEKR
ncbi:putative palmitoyltransferase ZDHHC14 [Morus notabilis]|uniref:S-acyltransferase n=1 Tax=Morus notabilis TaxID=981085 RepID=W9SIM5_9ROSA|nr:putative palmitoyltransferase ZDHHC14 [Morus notabilis]